MRIFILVVFIFMKSILEGYAVEISAEDKKILNSFWKYAEKHHFTELNTSEKISWTACFFIGTPYKSNTLEVTREEFPVINLLELDCVTFIENVLALSLLDKYDNESIDSFVNNITKLRYRDSEIIDYTSRLHYSSDWLYEMEEQGILTDITQFVGGEKYTKEINFMSKNFSKYPPLQKDELLEKIKNIETDINQRTYYYLPKDKIDEVQSKIKNGDIILITTNIKGLDTSHVGFALKKNGQTYLLHASISGKKVMISEQPLGEYMKNIKNQSGIMVARVAKQGNKH